jgi:hypothetical protein
MELIRTGCPPNKGAAVTRLTESQLLAALHSAVGSLSLTSRVQPPELCTNHYTINYMVA